MTAALRVEHLSVSYGGVKAVSDASLQVQAGQIVGLIGPNGAGKTSFIDAVTGFTPHNGSTILGDDCLDGLPPHRRSRLGLIRTFQQGELFLDINVGGNVEVVRRVRSRWLRGQKKDRTVPALTDDLLGDLRISEYADFAPDELPLGLQKLVGVARAIAAQPKVLVLDEPAAGLDERESRSLGDDLKRVRQSGIPMLLVDHDLNLVLSICDFIYVIDFGVLIAEGTPADVVRDERVIRAYIGESGTDSAGP